MLSMCDRWENNSRSDGDSGGRRLWAPDAVGNETAALAAENEPMPRLLLIEDDKETADEIRAELGDRGFDVSWAADGIEGLAKARSGGADAMIVDRLLPGMDGLTIIETLRSEGIRTPVSYTHLDVYKRQQGITTALWGARHPDQLQPVDEVTGWRLDASAKAEIDRILRETITDPVGPEFMAPPARAS